MIDGLAVVVIPTYNEAENIAELTSQVLAQEGVGSVLVVDDNSPDGTGRLADSLIRTYPGRVDAIHRPAKLGLGTAYVAGFRLALERGAERVITMDADFSHKPRYIPALLRAGRDSNLVIGSRYVPGGGVENWDLFRRGLSRGANLVARSLAGLAAHDCTSGFRCYHSSLLQAVPFDRIRSNGYSFLIEMLYWCQALRATVDEVPILFEDRQQGASKISSAEIGRAWITVLRLAVRRLR